jgi:hypothetical protein
MHIEHNKVSMAETRRDSTLKQAHDQSRAKMAMASACMRFLSFVYVFLRKVLDTKMARNLWGSINKTSSAFSYTMPQEFMAILVSSTWLHSAVSSTNLSSMYGVP